MSNDESDFTWPDESEDIEVLKNYTPSQVAQIMQTEYDAAIKGLLGTLYALTEFSEMDFELILVRSQQMFQAHMRIPEDTSIRSMRSYQELVDINVLGLLTQEWAHRQAEVAAES